MSLTTGYLVAVIALLVIFIILGTTMLNELLNDINKLESDIDGHLEADALKDGLLADQAAEIDRLTLDNTALVGALANAEANAADPAVIAELRAKVQAMSTKLIG